MPKLSEKATAQVESSEAVHGSSFEPIPAGKYLGRLNKVEERDTNGGNGQQWSARFDKLHTLGGEPEVGSQFLNLNLPHGTKGADKPSWYKDTQDKWDKYQNMSRGRLKAFFESLGYTADSDTDEMIGEWAVLDVQITTAQRGNRAGQKVNQVNGIEPVPSELLDLVTELAEAADAAEESGDDAGF